MQQPRIIARTCEQEQHNQRKRRLPQNQDDDYEEPFPVKKLAKNFEHSLGFSETNFSYSRSSALSGALNEEQRPQSAGNQAEVSLSSELRRAGLIPSDGVSRFKALLPVHLSTKLSPAYEFLLRVSFQTDRILSSRSLCHYMQSLSNLKLELSSSLFIDIELSMFEALNYLLPGLYVLCVDPLKNVVVGFPERYEELAMRRYTLRKEMYFHALGLASKEMRVGEVEEMIPLRSFRIARTALFFPNTSIKKNKKESALKPQFLKMLKQDIKKKQNILSSQHSNQAPAQPPIISFSELTRVLDLFQSCYCSFKVANMYRINLLEWFKRHSSDTPLEFYLNLIGQTGTYLHKKHIDESLLYELKKEQRSILLSKLTK